MRHYTSSQRGVSLMVLILAITVFAGVAAGVVTLLRVRHESYPYQVQSYQAYALANAGVEFAVRYARDNMNADGSGSFVGFFTGPNGIPSTGQGRKFTLPNGSYFYLRYVPGTGCSGTLYFPR